MADLADELERLRGQAEELRRSLRALEPLGSAASPDSYPVS